MVSSIQNGWFLPADSAPHQCTLMAYPNTTSANAGNLLVNAQNEIISIANAIAEFEPVVLLSSSETLQKVKSEINQNISVLCVEQTSHLWIRDFGPVFVKSQAGDALHGVDFNFNYWGGKRLPSGDELIAEIATKYMVGSSALQANITAEGGGMEVDGDGTFMAAESAIVNDNRNPDKTREQIEKELSRLFGVDKFLWLAGEVGKETTDCHIDALARFIRPGIVLLSKPSLQGSGKYARAYADAKAKLSNVTDARGRKLVLFDCLEPNLDKLDNVSQGENCVASYVNFLTVNGGVIIPRFGDEERDMEAFRLFEKLFPDREVVQVYINALPHIGGGIHCATQQVPAFTQHEDIS
ncbi:hypothetical protein V2G26_021412 [Clonostachys chloroleuca]